MIYHIPDLKSLKNSTKLEIILIVLFIGIGIIFTFVFLRYKDQIPLLKYLLEINGDMFSGLLLIVFSIIAGITFVINKIFQKYIKSIPNCEGCLNPLESYSIDLVKEIIKCKSCGYERSFYKFHDKLFLHYKFIEMREELKNDQLIKEKIDELLKKFENFEFNKKK